MTSAPSTPSRGGGSILARIAQPVLLLAIMWVVRVLDDLLPGDANGEFGLRSWAFDGLDGVLFGPGLHAGWPHLLANSIPFVVLGVLVALDGVGRFWAVTGIIAVVGGLGTWIFSAPGVVTVGASGLVFGYFGYLLVRAFVAPSLGHGILYALIATVMAVLYGGSMLTGVFAAPAGVSWQAHLFGAIGGGVAAIALRPKRIARA